MLKTQGGVGQPTNMIASDVRLDFSVGLSSDECSKVRISVAVLLELRNDPQSIAYGSPLIRSASTFVFDIHFSLNWLRIYRRDKLRFYSAA